jgi:hypothetical protein
MENVKSCVFDATFRFVHYAWQRLAICSVFEGDNQFLIYPQGLNLTSEIRKCSREEVNVR